MKRGCRLQVTGYSLCIAAVMAGCGARRTAPARADAPAPVLPAAAAHSAQALLAQLPLAQPPALTPMDAMTLAAYPLSCLDHIQAAPGGTPPRPSYLWQTGGASHLPPDYASQRAFYGCYDWHSAVNSTWTLVTLLQRFPRLPLNKLIRGELDAHLGKKNLAGELAYFQHAKGFERPYGQAWLLKLYGSLLAWNDPQARQWAANMAPLAQFFSKNLVSYLTHLPTPERIGVHPNTAFDMDLMLPYTAVAHDTALHAAIVATARRFYAQDQDCPTAYEPAGVSFLSPCLTEAALMAHLLPQPAFVRWYDGFMPEVYTAAFRPLLTPFDASKMTKDQMAGQSHLLGLAFSRAAAMQVIAAALPSGDARIPVLERLAAIHANAGFTQLDRAGYLETHWIATYALLYQLELAPLAPQRKMATAAPPANSI